MRIVNLKTFLELPAGTVFQKYEPCITEELMLKGDNVGRRDFIIAAMTGTTAIDVDDSGKFPETLEQAEREDVRLEQEIWMRDGMFEDDQMFMVWSEHDLYQLAGKLLQSAVQMSEGR